LSKLVLDVYIRDDYDRTNITEVIRAICNQVNNLSEGKIQARYQAQSVVPSSVAAQIGDHVWDLNTTVRGSVAPGVAASYVRLGWVCTVSDPNNPVWQEMRALTGT
jgi:hypothetical protein